MERKKKVLSPLLATENFCREGEGERGEREAGMRGRERRREKEGEEDPSCYEKISVVREGLHGKAYVQQKISVT